MESEHLKPSTQCPGHRKTTVTVACGEEDSEGHGDPWAAHAFLQTALMGQWPSSIRRHGQETPTALTPVP